MTTATKTRIFTPKEVASELCCSVDYVLSEIRRRRLSPVLRINQRVIRIPEATLESYRRSHTA